MQHTLKENINYVTHANAGHCFKVICVYQPYSAEACLYYSIFGSFATFF